MTGSLCGGGTEPVVVCWGRAEYSNCSARGGCWLWDEWCCHRLETIHVSAGGSKVSTGCLKGHRSVCQITFAVLNTVTIIQNMLIARSGWVWYPWPLFLVWFGKMLGFCDLRFSNVSMRFLCGDQSWFYYFYVGFEVES